MTLTAQQKTDLNNEIATDPKAKGYAALLPDKPGYVVDLLNEKNDVVNARTIMTCLKMMDVLGVAMYESVMTKLDAIAPSRIIVKDFLARFRSDSADIGSPTTLSMIDQIGAIAAPNGFTAEEVNALKNMSLQNVSRAEVLGLPFMTVELFLTRNL